LQNMVMVSVLDPNAVYCMVEPRFGQDASLLST
jgi:hypothetical protein